MRDQMMMLSNLMEMQTNEIIGRLSGVNGERGS